MTAISAEDVRLLRFLKDADDRGCVINFTSDKTVAARELVRRGLVADEGPTILGTGRYYGITAEGRRALSQSGEQK